MNTRIWPLRLPLAFLLALVFALPLPALAQVAQSQKDDEKRQKEVQQAMEREARPIIILVDELQKQQAAGDAQAFTVNPKENDPAKAVASNATTVDANAFAWKFDTMKAQDNKVYVPYNLMFPRDAMPQGPVGVYLRVVPKGSQPVTGKIEKGTTRYPFEDYFFGEPKAGAAGEPARMTRAFAVPPGEYDVYFAMRSKPADPKKGQNDPVRIVSLKRSVSLPDFWNGEITTSTVIVTSKVDTIQTQLTPEAQREHPYLFGTTEFTPSLDHKFKKTDELAVVFQIYNPGLEAGKPNVTVEYSFHRKLPEGEKYFNKTTPQQLNAETLPPSFDVASMQMLPGGQSVPLASFEPGDYRMEIKITDGVANKTITRDVAFTVVGA